MPPLLPTCRFCSQKCNFGKAGYIQKKWGIYIGSSIHKLQMTRFNFRLAYFMPSFISHLHFLNSSDKLLYEEWFATKFWLLLSKQ